MGKLALNLLSRIEGAAFMTKVSGGSNAMANSSKRLGHGVFTVSGRQGNSSPGVFEELSLPNGDTVKIMDRRVLERALAETKPALKESARAIRKNSADGKSDPTSRVK